MEHPNLEEIEKSLKETSDISNNYLNHKLKIFAFRWTITILLYALLWTKFTWIKWTLLLVIPLGLFNLWQIISIRNKLNKKVEDIKQTIDNIEQR